MGPIGCPEKSVTNYQSTLCNIPEERRSQIPTQLGLILLRKTKNVCKTFGSWAPYRTTGPPVVFIGGFLPPLVCTHRKFRPFAHINPSKYTYVFYLIILFNLIIPTLLSLVSGPLPGNGCGSPNISHIIFIIYFYLLLY